jgi:hypothetical protein
VPQVDLGVREGDVAGVVAPDEGERLVDRAFRQQAAAGQIDPQVQRVGRATRFGEPGDQRVVHDPVALTEEGGKGRRPDLPSGPRPFASIIGRRAARCRNFLPKS